MRREARRTSKTSRSKTTRRRSFEATERELRVKVKATARNPDPLSRPFLASLFRANHATIGRMRREWVPREEIQDRIDRAREEGKEDAPHEAAAKVRALEAKIALARPILAELGVDIDVSDYSWKSDGKELAAALRLGQILLGGREENGKYHKSLDHVVTELDHIVTAVSDARTRLGKLVNRER